MNDDFNIFLKESKKIKLILFFISFLIIICTFLFTKIQFTSGIIFSSIFLLLVVLFPIEYDILILFFLFPFNSILKMSFNSITIIPIIEMIIMIKIIVHDKIFFSSKQLIIFLLFLVIQLFTCIFYQSDIISITSFFISLIFTVFVCDDYKINKNLVLQYVGLFLIVAVLLESIIGYFNPDVALIVGDEKALDMQIAGRFSGLNSDPNEYSQLVLLSIAFLLCKLCNVTKLIEKIFDLLLIAVLIFFGINTYSKSFAITLMILIFFFYLIYIKKTVNLNVKGLIILLLSLIAIIIVFYFVYNKIIVYIFEKRYSDDILTGRDEIWSKYLYALSERIDALFFGVGYGNVLKLINIVGLNETHVPHNIYIEYVTQFGLVGIFLWINILPNFSTSIKKTVKSPYFLVLIVFLVTSFAISSNNSDLIYLIIIFMNFTILNNLSQDVNKI